VLKQETNLGAWPSGRNKTFSPNKIVLSCVARNPLWVLKLIGSVHGVGFWYETSSRVRTYIWGYISFVFSKSCFAYLPYHL